MQKLKFAGLVLGALLVLPLLVFAEGNGSEVTIPFQVASPESGETILEGVPYEFMWAPFKESSFDFYYISVGNSLCKGYINISPGWQPISKDVNTISATVPVGTIKQIVANCGGKTEESLKNEYVFKVTAEKEASVGSTIVAEVNQVFTLLSNPSDSSSPPPAPPAPFAISSPNGREALVLGSSKDITWGGSMKSSDLVTIHLVYCGGSVSCPKVNEITPFNSFEVVRQAPARAGKFSWRVGQVLTLGVGSAPPGNYVMRECLLSGATSVCDMSDSYFKIVSSEDAPADLTDILDALGASIKKAQNTVLSGQMSVTELKEIKNLNIIFRAKLQSSMPRASRSERKISLVRVAEAAIQGSDEAPSSGTRVQINQESRQISTPPPSQAGLPSPQLLSEKIDTLVNEAIAIATAEDDNENDLDLRPAQILVKLLEMEQLVNEIHTIMAGPVSAKPAPRSGFGSLLSASVIGLFTNLFITR